jgi:hypothetical protein
VLFFVVKLWRENDNSNFMLKKVTLPFMMHFNAFIDVVLKYFRDFFFVGLLYDFGMLEKLFGLVLGLKVFDENVLIDLSRLGLFYHIKLLEFQSAPAFEKLENRLFVLLVDKMLDEVIVFVSKHLLDDFD